MFCEAWCLPKSISLLSIRFAPYTVLKYKLECEEKKPEEEPIDLTAEATPWKETRNKTPRGTSVQPKKPQLSVGSSRNSPALNAGHFRPKYRNFLWEVAKETVTLLP